MRHAEADDTPLHDPLAELERQLITAYVAGAGHDIDDLLRRNDPEALRILAEASRYVSTRLSEVQARSQYLRRLHGDA